MKQSTKVPKSGKTRLSDLTPKKDARGGLDPQPTPPIYYGKTVAARRPAALSVRSKLSTV
jgi:hypothetical protein